MNDCLTPLVSVIIPTVKYDKFTHQADLSVLSQNYTNWEIILVLDGASLWDVPEGIKNDSRIVIPEQPQRLGTPATLNNGAKVAKGPFIARLDADDVAHPDRFSAQVLFLNSHPEVCCVGSSGFLIGDKNDFLGEVPQKPEGLDIRLGLLEANQLIHSSVMYRKSSFDQIGGYNPKMTRMQDYDLFLRLGRLAPIAYLDEFYCAYRTHPGQHSRKTSPFKPYTFEILRQRRCLCQSLNQSIIPSQIIRDLKWYGAQVLRYLGLRKPNY